MPEFVCGEGEGDGADGADVGGDVFAGGAVAAGEAAQEAGASLPCGAVVEGEREAVELVFADVLEGIGAVERGGDTVGPGAELGFVVGVVEREHGAGVGDLCEAVLGLAADALGGAVGGDELRVLGFEGLEAVDEFVVLAVGEDGGVEHVVEVFVVLDLCGGGRRLGVRRIFLLCGSSCRRVGCGNDEAGRAEKRRPAPALYAGQRWNR